MKCIVSCLHSYTCMCRICIANSYLVIAVVITVIHDLGVFFDSELTMKSHISPITNSDDCMQFGASLDKKSQVVSSRHSSCQGWTTAMPFGLAFRDQHLHHSSGLCMPLPESSTTLNHTTMSLWHKALHWLPVKQRTEFKLCHAGPSSYQQTGTYLPTAPDNYCIHVWSCLKPLSQQQGPCQTVNQPQIWCLRLLCCWTSCLESAALWPQSHQGNSYF